MLERFTTRARKVIVLARDEAERFNHNYLGTEHILLGLIKEGEGVALAVLKSMGVSLGEITSQVESLLVKGENKPPKEIAFTARARKVFELSWEESQMMGHNYVGTEHLLLGLLREGGGIAATVMKKLGMDIDVLREEIITLLSGEQAGSGRGSPKSGARGKSKTPALDEFSRDLTKLAREGKLDPIIGREDEMDRLVQILSRRKKNNPVLIGEPGVGKTAIVEGLAQRIINKEVPPSLQKRRLLTLDLAGIVAGTKYRGQFEERLKAIINEITSSDDFIIFIDELHTIVGAGAAEGAIDASNMLKPALSRGELQCIGATTLDEYRKHIEKDGSLERRFQTIMVNPPTVEETKQIIKGLRSKYEAHHQVEITEEAVEMAVRLADRYIADRQLPDKAIDIIDEAQAMVRLRNEAVSPEAEELLDSIRQVSTSLGEAVARQDFEKAGSLRDEEREIRRKFNGLMKGLSTEGAAKKLTAEDVAVVVSKWTGIPLTRLEMGENQRLLNMKEALHKRIIGQDEAIDVVCRAIRRSRAGVKDTRRPIGSFVFLGPTGVGKTELAKALAEFLFDDEDAMVRIDMSEYMERFAISRLIGAPPGYVGYEEGGQLTEKVRRKPYSLVLLDEIEKAHPDVFNLLLQILEDGRLTDSFGRVVSFRNVVLVMTSNIGAREIKDGATIGFQSSDGQLTYERMKDTVLGEVKRVFNPEFLNRLDEVIVFHALDKDHLTAIVELMVTRVAGRLAEHSISIALTKSATNFIIDEGYNPQYGARPLRRTIQRLIEDPLAELILKKEVSEGAHLILDLSGTELVFREEAPLSGARK